MSLLVILLPRKGYLQHFGSKIAKTVRCYCHNLGQSEKKIFDSSLCVQCVQECHSLNCERRRSATPFNEKERCRSGPHIFELSENMSSPLFPLLFGEVNFLQTSFFLALPCLQIFEIQKTWHH